MELLSYVGAIFSIIVVGLIILVLAVLYRVTTGHGTNMEGDNVRKLGPKDFFMYLFAFGTLYASVVSLAMLLFAYIDKLVPDVLAYNYYGAIGFEQIRWPMAMLIVLVPIFLVLSHKIGNDIAMNPEKKESQLYRLMVYFTLFLAGMTLAIDLVAVIYSFLGGDITLRFVLKALVVFLIALDIFIYYRWHLRTDLAIVAGKRKAILWTTVIVILASVIAGFFIIGSPFQQRARRMDERRVSDLQQAQGMITNYWTAKNKLPTSLSEVETQDMKDPESGLPYEYRVTADLSFELCAIFKTNSPDENSPRPIGMYGVPDIGNFNDWEHGVGRMCFDRTIDTDFFKPTDGRPIF